MDSELPENFKSLREGKETANEYFEIHELVITENIYDKLSLKAMFKKMWIYSYCWNNINVPLILIAIFSIFGLIIKKLIQNKN